MPSNTGISTFSPPDTKSMKCFNFQGLPGEIRNRIYEFLLCDFEEVLVPCKFRDLPSPSEVTITRQSIHPQILRTCRQIYQEGTCLMRKKNLFIRFECEVSPYQISLALIKMQVPFIVPDPSVSKDFKGTALTHKICYRNSKSRPEPNASFILLARHIPILCRALSSIRWSIDQHDDNVKHVVTLTDPYDKQTSGIFALFASVSGLFSSPKESEPFLSRKEQEGLIAPYRTHLKAFPNLEFNGVIPKDLKTIATSEITFMPEAYNKDQIKMFLDNIEDMILQGEVYYGQERKTKANRTWNECQRLITYQSSGKRGERLRKGGGVDFLNSIAETLFDLACIRARTTCDLLETKWEGNHEKILMEGMSMTEAEINQAVWLNNHETEVTFIPSAGRLADMYWRESIAYRSAGLLNQAKTAIELALITIPNRERYLIEEDEVDLAFLAKAERKLSHCVLWGQRGGLLIIAYILMEVTGDE
ncbi:hypothetical protein ACHAP3_004088 [Botrytis cinerea]